MVNETSMLRNLIKIDRITSWILLVALIMFFMTGYTMTGKYGFNQFIDIGNAIMMHTTLCEIVIVLLGYHVLVRGYLELKRIGILGRGKDQTQDGQEPAKDQLPPQEGK